MATSTFSVRELYAMLLKRAEEKASSYRIEDLIVRTCSGIKKDHAMVVTTLFWWHIFLTDRPLYAKLKAVTDEGSMREVLDNKPMVTFVQGERATTVPTDIYPDKFLQIIDAYIDFADELSTRR